MPARALMLAPPLGRAMMKTAQLYTMNLTHSLSLRLDLDRQPQGCAFSLSQTLPPPDVYAPFALLFLFLQPHRWLGPIAGLALALLLLVLAVLLPSLWYELELGQRFLRPFPCLPLAYVCPAAAARADPDLKED
ncbi:hypothetical protein GALMADRAFT_148884 [Galerina marginata CBS 339.88]|uniref:Uncharacterized protein n=1 Tax=Galerina marginata (strain CBS 339.88) TaxID=685588 RepID=A0A067S303_GALM3|nr:hypothetical protein GALMADRAFT_148884 [Galerina marginata CBS 339.88]